MNLLYKLIVEALRFISTSLKTCHIRLPLLTKFYLMLLSVTLSLSHDSQINTFNSLTLNVTQLLKSSNLFSNANSSHLICCSVTVATSQPYLQSNFISFTFSSPNLSTPLIFPVFICQPRIQISSPYPQISLRFFVCSIHYYVFSSSSISKTSLSSILYLSFSTIITIQQAKLFSAQEGEI